VGDLRELPRATSRGFDRRNSALAFLVVTVAAYRRYDGRHSGFVCAGDRCRGFHLLTSGARTDDRGAVPVAPLEGPEMSVNESQQPSAAHPFLRSGLSRYDTRSLTRRRA